MKKTGQCMCSAVKFTASEAGNFGVCHCEQCRRWQGSALFAVTVADNAMQIEGAENITSFRSSEWASRAFCSKCGSGLWYRYDKGTDGTGNYEVALGLFDDPSGLPLQREIFIDQKPDNYALSGDHPRLTRTETFALYGVDTGDA